MASPTVETVRWVILIGFLLLCLVFGGSSRGDVAGVIAIEIAAVLAGAIALLLPGSAGLRRVSAPLWFLVALAAVMAIQLVPLPPALWTHLQGHGQFAAVATIAGIEQPWRPISLTPDLTLESLAFLSIPAAVLLLAGTLPAERMRRLLPYVIAAIALTTVLGVAQIAGGPDSAFYRYRVTNPDSAVGFLSNRNHQAVFMACGLPMLALWASSRSSTSSIWLVRRGLAMTLLLLLLPAFFMTGSRAGLALALAGLVMAVIQYRLGRDADTASALPTKVIGVGVAVGAIALVAVIMLMARTPALDRLMLMSVEEDLRVRFLPVIYRMASDFYVLGSGFGSFDPLFRFYEPDAFLKPTYLNHAHNDVLELVITGGLAACLVALGFLGWVIMRVARLLRAPTDAPGTRFGWLGLMVLAILVASSVVDYPMRTPLLAALAAIACAWLCGERSRRAQTAR